MATIVESDTAATADRSWRVFPAGSNGEYGLPRDLVIVIDSGHSASTVVWNPGAEGIASLGDVPLNDWYQYLCIEAGNCAPLDRVVLAPGGKTVLTQRIGCEALFVA